MRLKRILLPALVVAGTALAAFSAVHAQDGSFGLDTAACGAGLCKNKDLLVTIGNLIRTVLGYLGVLFLVLMLYSGFLYMTARGDDKKITSAKQIIQGAVIGMLIIAGSYILTSFVIDTIAKSVAEPSPVSQPQP